MYFFQTEACGGILATLPNLVNPKHKIEYHTLLR